MLKNKRKVLILLLITLIIITGFSMYAYARLRTVITGQGTAQIANWQFCVIDGIPATSGVIDFAITRTDSNEKVISGKIAPGTYGQFEVGVDPRNSEVGLTYNITVELTSKIRNIKFYSDALHTQEIILANDKIEIENYLSTQNVQALQEPITQTIYWDWPYETGIQISEIAMNDEIDTTDATTTMQMEIMVIGTQVAETPIYLADVVTVGDYVNYNAASGTASSYTSSNCPAGVTISASFSSTDTMTWRVLNVDQSTGTVELISADATAQTVTLDGKTGYKNSISTLNAIGAVYGHGIGATSGRSAKIEDLERYSSYNPYTYINTNSSTGYYGGTKEYTSGAVINEDGTELTASTTTPVKLAQTYYAISDETTQKGYYSNETIYNILFKSSALVNKTYWLASHGLNLGVTAYSFSVYRVNAGYLNANVLYRSDASTDSNQRCVTPIVTLEANIQTTGQDGDGIWQLN